MNIKNLKELKKGISLINNNARHIPHYVLDSQYPCKRDTTIPILQMRKLNPRAPSARPLSRWTSEPGQNPGSKVHAGRHLHHLSCGRMDKKNIHRKHSLKDHRDSRTWESGLYGQKEHSQKAQPEGPPQFQNMREQPFRQHSGENPRTERSNMTSNKWNVGSLREAEEPGRRKEQEINEIENS